MVGVELPWNKIHEYLLSLETAPSKEELLALAFSGIGKLIPWDTGAYLIDYDCDLLGGLGVGPKDLELYSGYYRERIPIWIEGRLGVPLPRLLASNRVYWQDFRESEFVTDFARPRGWARCIGQLRRPPGARSALCLQRSATGPDFTDAEVATLEVASLHIDNLLSIFDQLSSSEGRRLSPAALRKAFPSLSSREAEVARLSILGLSAREIAVKLFISERTAEAHVAHIYARLGVRSRAQLRARLETVFGPLIA